MPICGAGADTYESMLTSVPALDRAAEHRQNRTKLTFRAIQQRVVTALFRRGAQDPSKVDRLKGTTQRIGRVSSSHLAATNHRAACRIVVIYRTAISQLRALHQLSKQRVLLCFVRLSYFRHERQATYVTIGHVLSERAPRTDLGDRN